MEKLEAFALLGQRMAHFQPDSQAETVMLTPTKAAEPDGNEGCDSQADTLPDHSVPNLDPDNNKNKDNEDKLEPDHDKDCDSKAATVPDDDDPLADTQETPELVWPGLKRRRRYDVV